jgi:hypothetical protein
MTVAYVTSAAGGGLVHNTFKDNAGVVHTLSVNGYLSEAVPVEMLIFTDLLVTHPNPDPVLPEDPADGVDRVFYAQPDTRVFVAEADNRIFTA